MILEHLEKLLRTEADNRPPNNPFRASAMGRCWREGCFDLLGLRGEPMQPRRMLVLMGGSTIHDDLLIPLIKQALEDSWVDVAGLPDFVEIDGARIGYHLDFAFRHTSKDCDCWDVHANLDLDINSCQCPCHAEKSIGVGEIKSMADFSFNRALKGEIDHDYLCQAWVYQKATSFNPVVFIAYRKETSAMVEICFDRNATEKVVTQRLTGNPVELAKTDPILLTEIKSPFDPSVEEYVRERIRYLKLTQRKELHCIDNDEEWVRQFVPGADAVEDEVEKVQGIQKLEARIDALKQERGLFNHDLDFKVNGSWYSFKTGRKILGFPCSYCGHKLRCFLTAQMEMKGDRPVWVIPSPAKVKP